MSDIHNLADEVDEIVNNFYDQAEIVEAEQALAVAREALLTALRSRYHARRRRDRRAALRQPLFVPEDPADMPDASSPLASPSATSNRNWVLRTFGLPERQPAPDQEPEHEVEVEFEPERGLYSDSERSRTARSRRSSSSSGSLLYFGQDGIHLEYVEGVVLPTREYSPEFLRLYEESEYEDRVQAEVYPEIEPVGDFRTEEDDVEDEWRYEIDREDDVESKWSYETDREDEGKRAFAELERLAEEDYERYGADADSETEGPDMEIEDEEEDGGVRIEFVGENDAERGDIEMCEDEEEGEVEGVDYGDGDEEDEEDGDDEDGTDHGKEQDHRGESGEPDSEYDAETEDWEMVLDETDDY